MQRPVHILNRALLALGIAASLAFGVAEAFASSRPERDASRPWCDPVQCNAACGGYGICQNFTCLCY